MEKRIGLLSKHINAAHEFAERRCLHFDRTRKRCRKEAIQSHSLQKRGPLKSISENGHVIKFGRTLAANALVSKDFCEKIGVKKASIFRGFCPEHDSSIFAEIERETVILNERTALVFLIRAQAMEYHRKQVMKQLLSGLLIEDGLPRDRERELFLKLTMKGCNKAIADGEMKLKQYFSCLHGHIPSNFKFIAARFSKNLPFAATGAFEPDFDFNHNFLFSDDPLKLRWNSVGVFSGNIGDSPLFFLSGFQRYKEHRIDKFIHSLSQKRDIFPSLLTTLLCAFSENVFFREGFFNALPMESIEKLKTLLDSGVYEGIRNSQVLDLRVPIGDTEITEFVANV